MASSTAITYDPFGIIGGSSGVGKGTTRSNSTGGSPKSNAGVEYDPFNIRQQNLQTPLTTPVAKPIVPAPKPQSLLSKAAGVGKTLLSGATGSEQTAAKGIARILPGGLNDVKAQQQQASQADQTVANTVAEEKAGKINKTQANNIIQAQAGNAANASKQQAQTIRAMPTTSQVAAGVAGTGADIITAGAIPELKGAGLLAKTANIATKAGAFGASGALNSAATGGTKKQVAENTILGAALPGVAHVAGKILTKGITQTGEKLADTKVGQVTSGVKTLVGKDQATNDLIRNSKTQSLLNTIPKDQSRSIAVAVNPDHVSQGLIHPEIHQTPIKDIAISADNVHKLDQAKVGQYAKQMKDGEPIEPIVTHEIGDQTHIVDGQHRLAAAQKLGHDTVPTVEKVPGAVPTTTSQKLIQPDNVITLNDKQYKLQGGALDQYKIAKAKYDQIIKNNVNDKTSFGDSRRKAAGMQLSAAKRQITGDLTSKEQQTILDRERSAYVGKQIEMNVNGKTVKGTIASQPAFGNVKLKLEDGSMISVKHDDLPEDNRNTNEILNPHTNKEGVSEYVPSSQTLDTIPSDTSRTFNKEQTAVEQATTPEAEVQAKQALVTKSGDKALAGEQTTNKSAGQIFMDAQKEGKPVTMSEAKTMAKVSNAKQVEYNPKSSKPVVTVPIEEPKTDLNSPDIKTSKLGIGVEQNAIKKGLTEGFADKPEYAKVNVKNQAEAASQLLKSDPDRAFRVAMGKEPAPEGLLPESAYIAVENQATKLKDGEMLRQLATKSHLVSEASGMGQRIRMLGERDTNSAAAKITQVAKARTDAFEAKSKLSTPKAISKEIQQIRAAKPKVTKQTWGDFVESLKC